MAWRSCARFDLIRPCSREPANLNLISFCNITALSRVAGNRLGERDFAHRAPVSHHRGARTPVNRKLVPAAAGTPAPIAKACAPDASPLNW